MAIKLDFKVTRIDRSIADDGVTELNVLYLEAVDPAGDTNANNYGYWDGAPNAVFRLQNLVNSKVSSVTLGQIVGITFGAP